MLFEPYTEKELRHIVDFWCQTDAAFAEVEFLEDTKELCASTVAAVLAAVFPT
jgi:Cdc6-like AAA superfamily ATPase